MEERLQKALEFANYSQTLNNQLQKSRIRAEGALIIAKNGGSFKVDQSLICFLDLLERKGMTEANLLDTNNRPVKIEDVSGFLKEVTSRYFEVTNDYLQEYQTVKKSRNVKSVLDLKETE